MAGEGLVILGNNSFTGVSCESCQRKESCPNPNLQKCEILLDCLDYKQVICG